MKDPAVSLHMNLEIILYLGAGVLCAFLPLRFQYLMLFPFLTYGYLHNRRALLFFLFSHVLFLGALSVSTAYLTLLGILIFFLPVSYTHLRAHETWTSCWCNVSARHTVCRYG